MSILRTIPPGEMTLGGYKITIPTYVLSPGARPPVHCWIAYRGLELWFACQGRKEEPAKGFDGAMDKMPAGRRVVMAVTEGLLNSEAALDRATAPDPEPASAPTPAPAPDPEAVDPEPAPEAAETDLKTQEVFTADEGQQVLVINQETGDEVSGTIVEAESRSINVMYGDDVVVSTFTKRTNDTWIEKGEPADSGLQVVLVA